MKVIIDYPKNKNKFRQVSITIHTKDLWNMDKTLAHIIHPMLIKYRSLYKDPIGMGIPSSFYGVAQVIDDKTDENALKEWLKVLDTMIYAFYWIKAETTFGPHAKAIHKEIDDAVAIAIKDKKLLRNDFKMDAYGPVFDKWRPKLDEHEAKIKEGLRLFAEHYQSLWT